MAPPLIWQAGLLSTLPDFIRLRDSDLAALVRLLTAYVGTGHGEAQCEPAFLGAIAQKFRDAGVKLGGGADADDGAASLPEVQALLDAAPAAEGDDDAAAARTLTSEQLREACYAALGIALPNEAEASSTPAPAGHGPPSADTSEPVEVVGSCGCGCGGGK